MSKMACNKKKNKSKETLQSMLRGESINYKI